MKFSPKYTYLFLTFLGLMPASTQADGNIGVGVTLGGINSLVLNQYNYGNKELAYTFDPGLLVGGMAYYGFTPASSVQLEVKYASMGQYYVGSVQAKDGADIYRNLDLNYLQVPLLYRYTTSTKSKFRFRALGGPTLGFLLSASDVYVNSDKSEVSRNVPDALPRFSPFDFGLTAELGGEWSVVPRVIFSLGLRAYTGLTNINKYDEEWINFNRPRSDEKSQNAYVGIDAGIHYVLQQSRRNRR